MKYLLKVAVAQQWSPLLHLEDESQVWMRYCAIAAWPPKLLSALVGVT